MTSISASFSSAHSLRKIIPHNIDHHQTFLYFCRSSFQRDTFWSRVYRFALIPAKYVMEMTAE